MNLWDLADAADLAAALSNRKVQDNLRDGLPYPYTKQDGVDLVSLMCYLIYMRLRPDWNFGEGRV